jgi:predicted esterase
MKKTGIIGIVHKLPKFLQKFLLHIGFLQRSQTYITNMPNMLPMLDKEGGHAQQFTEELAAIGLLGTKSIFINMSGVVLHALYFPPKNGKLICAFHGIKGNWFNNPMPVNPSARDAEYNPRYRMVLLEEFAREGFGFLAFTVPGFNPSQGRASEKNFIKSCEKFAVFTKNHALNNGIKPQDIIVCGESLGGALASIFAAKLTAIAYPPAVLSLIATFDSLISMTQNEFPNFSNAELAKILCEKLDTTNELSRLNKDKTYINIVAAREDNVIPMQNTMNLLYAARKLGFNVLYHLVAGEHTTWDKKTVLGIKKLTHMARQRSIEIAAHHSVLDIEAILALKDSQ